MVGKASFVVEVAEGLFSRARGLSGRPWLGEGEGMIFVFRRPGRYAFWMRGMKFPLDIIWINGGKVAGVTEDVAAGGFAAWRSFRSPQPADRVLEVSAGTVKNFGIKEGDPVG